ncbi:ejaculatory bulb-specific protein 3 [Halyomorpha halys]|uniref:ejaculatory bulb-specific protein 3 n=1 Tax=Halyomorpha halys TaxID=286706 RepID=UPI0006D4D5DF|nr:ejaculatory bulb-specific protein 3-like [Halyomorpha halys]
MKLVLLLVFVIGATFAAEVYTSKYDNIDVDKILSNDRILSQYIKCLMEEGNCTNEGRELKKTLPDALATGCAKCSEKQKAQTEKVLRHLTKNRPRDWARLKTKYDPTGEYSKKYEPKATTAAPAAA